MKARFQEASSMEEEAQIIREKLEIKRKESEEAKRVLSEKLSEQIEEFQKLGMSDYKCQKSS